MATTAALPTKKPSALGRARGSLSTQFSGTIGGHAFEPEYRFAPVVDGKHVRQWRFDFAFPGLLLAVEVEGGMFFGGRHGGARSVVRDLEKYTAAATLGWRVIKVTPQQVKTGRALEIIQSALGLREIDL
jgi:hypothetical protein